MAKNPHRNVFFLFVLVMWVWILASLVAGEENIKLDVSPKVATTSELKRTDFRIRIVIPENKDNRILSYYGDCGSEIRTSQKEIDHVVYEWFEDYTVKADCYFQACVHRIVAGKVKEICVHQEVIVNGE